MEEKLQKVWRDMDTLSHIKLILITKSEAYGSNMLLQHFGRIIEEPWSLRTSLQYTHHANRSWPICNTHRLAVFYTAWGITESSFQRTFWFFCLNLIVKTSLKHQNRVLSKSHEITIEIRQAQGLSAEKCGILFQFVNLESLISTSHTCRWHNSLFTKS